MSSNIAHTSRMTIHKHDGPHRTAMLDGFDEPIHFSIHGGIEHFYREKYGRSLDAPKYPATLDYLIASVGG